MTKLISILICTIPSRKKMLDELVTDLNHQIMKSGRHEEIEICVCSGTGSIGSKRNTLMTGAIGKYVAYIDDDDKVGPFYVSTLIDGADKGFDCVSLRGHYSVNGVFDGVFEHSIKYNAWETLSNGQIKYVRMPNHLNLIKKEIAEKFPFPDKNFSEDHDFSKRLHESGLIKSEYYTEEILYYYNYISGK